MNPKGYQQPGIGWDPNRLVIDINSGKAWYTPTHYGDIKLNNTEDWIDLSK